MALPRGSRHRAQIVTAELATRYPGGASELCALRHDSPFQLLAATILSAQCTDVRVNMATEGLFAAYPDADSMAAAPLSSIEQLVKSIGLFRAKAKYLKGMAGIVASRYGGSLPGGYEELTALPGVGRKTANVVRSVSLGLPGLPVDTHVLRLSRRLKLSAGSTPEAVEADLCRLVEPGEWGTLSLRLILFGRELCTAQSPRCEDCPFATWCPSSTLPARA